VDGGGSSEARGISRPALGQERARGAAGTAGLSGRGEADLAFEWLERAYAQRDGGLLDIKGSRFLRGLAGDPRYEAFLRKLKLPE
jgi:hypothetical protein